MRTENDATIFYLPQKASFLLSNLQIFIPFDNGSKAVPQAPQEVVVIETRLLEAKNDAVQMSSQKLD